MTREVDARRAALEAFHKTIDAGLDRERALEVALARYGAIDPSASEFDARTALIKALADQRATVYRPAAPSKRAR
jgi:hypothetical protein